MKHVFLRPAMRRLSSVLGLSSALLLGVAAGPAAAERVVFGTPGSISDNSLAVQVAIDQGFYKEAGIDAEVINFKGGAPGIQALVGGGVQYAIAAPEHVIRLRNRGVDATVAFLLQGSHTYALLVPEKSPVRRFDDLKGKRIGITSSGSLTENLVRLEAIARGWTFGTDVQTIGAGVGAAQKAALDTGRIDAGMFGNFDTLQLEKEGYRIAFDWRTQKVPALGLLATEAYQKAHPEIARGVVTATLKAQQLIIRDRGVTLRALKKLYPNLQDALLEQVASHLAASLSPTGLADRDAYDKLQDDLRKIEPGLKPVDYAVANPGTYLPRP